MNGDRKENARDGGRQRIGITIRGAVQGVGFRPFVYRLAGEIGVGGWICNTGDGVRIEIEGPKSALPHFLERVESDKPTNASIQRVEWAAMDATGSSTFEIRSSDVSGARSTPVLPDIAICDDCRREILDASDRRHRYPFTNCTNCGPRYSIATALPYDRPNTSMIGFEMCPRCQREYTNPEDRRFHAQANACADCGPRVQLIDSTGEVVAWRDEAMKKAADALRQGAIVAVKGMGGFHLMVDAFDDEAVRRLRERKQREEKPLALMFPTLDSVLEHCEATDVENRLLVSPQSPIVLLRARQPVRIARSVAPGNPYLGAMVPYTPLHEILMADVGAPVVATSGNMSEEPICIAGDEAIDKLGAVADLFLDHDRPIVRPVDDSVVCVIADRPLVIRRARGYAPLPFFVEDSQLEARRTLAVGAHLKNTVAVSFDGQTIVSQHIGDLATTSSFESFERTIAWLRDLYDLDPNQVICDMHPDYRSTIFAEGLGRPVIRVQHHHAHVLSCVAEHAIEGAVLGVCWDGTGYGTDGTVWGGEFLRSDGSDFTRVAHLKTFKLPGGELAIGEPRRSAIGVLHEILGDTLWERQSLATLDEFTPEERPIVRAALDKGLNAPTTSSAGRLFDAVASLVGVCQRAGFEGQAAMALEFAADTDEKTAVYPFDITGLDPLVVDWAPMIRAIIDDTQAGEPVGRISAVFHNSLAEMIVEVAKRCGEERVVLTGGCFQNRLLSERTIERLRKEGLVPIWHERIPPNDGGIAFGQIAAAAFAARRRG